MQPANAPHAAAGVKALRTISANTAGTALALAATTSSAPRQYTTAMAGTISVAKCAMRRMPPSSTTAASTAAHSPITQGGRPVNTPAAAASVLLCTMLPDVSAPTTARAAYSHASAGFLAPPSM